MNEKISALMDSELGKKEQEPVLIELRHDANLSQTWERYHLIGGALRNELEILVDATFADQVIANIEKEAIVIVPRRWQQGSFQRMGRFAAGIAIAASVSVVAILSLPFIVHLGAQTKTQLAQVTTPIIQSTPGVTQVADNTQNNLVNNDEGRRREWQSSLNPFLVEHSEFTPTTGMNGMISYAHVAGYTTANQE